MALRFQQTASRRAFMIKAGLGAAALSLPAWLNTPGAFADELTRTPQQTIGPFYPDKLPLDTDNDLLIVNNQITSAVGEVTHLSGRILDPRGNPVRGALVEIWQVDSHGIYLHTGGGDRDKLDKNFQGFGRFLTGSTGEYYFRTIKPTAYPGRTPHIHVAVRTRGAAVFTTQCYIKNEPQNARDGILMSVRDVKARDSLVVDFAPLKESKIGELAARFDIVLGFTPAA